MRSATRVSAVLAMMLLVAGCGTKTLYEWGDYQNSLYVMWVEPEDFDPADHLRILTEQVAEIESEERAVPPGVRAHIGMLQHQAGNVVEARRYLAAEKAAFPESTIFVDGLLNRMGP